MSIERMHNVMSKWIIPGTIVVALFVFGGIVVRALHPSTTWTDAMPKSVEENNAPSEVNSGDMAIHQNAESERRTKNSQPHIGSAIDTINATVHVSSAKPSEDKRWGKQLAVTLEMVGKGDTAQPLPRVMQSYLEDARGRWTPVSGREARWQEAFLLPANPLRITLLFRGMSIGDSTFALETSEGIMIVPLAGEDTVPTINPFRCENSSGLPQPLQAEIRRVWRMNASPMAQPLPDYQFLGLEMNLRPTEGYAPHLQLSNVLLTDEGGNQYPATPYALPVNEQLSVWGDLVSERKALVGFEVPLNANPHCLVIVAADEPVYVPLPGG